MNHPITSDKLHRERGGPFPTVYPKERRAPVRVRIWLPRYGADLMISVLSRGDVVSSRSLNTRDPKVAEQAAWDLVAAVAAQKEEKVEKQVAGPLRLARLITLYLKSAEHASLSASHRVEKESKLHRWVKFLGRATVVDQISKEDVRRYEVQRRRTVKQQTVYGDWSALRSVVNWALAEKLLRVNPLAGISVATEKNPVQYLVSNQEYLALRNKSRGKVSLLVRVYLSIVEASDAGRWPSLGYAGKT